MRVGFFVTGLGTTMRERLQMPFGIDAVAVPDEAALLAQLPTFDALVLSTGLYTPAIADAVARGSGRLRWIQALSTGLDPFETTGWPGQLVLTGAGAARADAVADHALSLLLSLLRQVPAIVDAQRRHHWSDEAIKLKLRNLGGAHVLVVGYGAIGQAVARRLKGFGSRVTAINRSGRGDGPADEVVAVDRLGELLPGADALVLCLPAQAGGLPLLGARELATLRSSALLVNVGRGDTLDAAALFEALRAGRLAGAALDVFEAEPVVADDRLWDTPNLIVSPHVGGMGDGVATLLAAMVGENLRRFTRGEALLNIDPRRQVAL